MNASKYCPVCGYEMDDPPWANDRSPSDEICPSCGIQFGYSDMTGGNIEGRKYLHLGWRLKWRQDGMRWSSTFGKPENWDPIKQLKNIDIEFRK